MKRNLVVTDDGDGSEAQKKRRVFQLAILPKIRINVPKMSNEEAYGVLRDVYEGVRDRVFASSSEGSGRREGVVFWGMAFEIWAQGGDGRVDVLGGGYLREMVGAGGGSGNDGGLQSS